jgi:hypothetical protein
MEQTETANSTTCPSCAAAQAAQANQAISPFVYAIGRIDLRYPRPSIEKELAHVIGRAPTTGLTDKEALHTVLNNRQNRYLARQLCWVLTVQGQDTYILAPRDPMDLDLLIQSLRPTPSPTDMDAVVGMRGPLSTPDVCNGLILPILFFDQIYSFGRDSLLEALPQPKDVDAKKFTSAAAEVFDRLMQQSDNDGASGADRALNFLAVRDSSVYTTAARAFTNNGSLSAISVKPSPLSGPRNIVDVIFTFANRATDVVEKYFTRVDVTEEFPYLVSKLSPYYDR